jgi:hypothetical protein
MRFDSKPATSSPGKQVTTFVAPESGWYRLIPGPGPDRLVKLSSEQDAAAYGCEELFTARGPGYYTIITRINWTRIA